MCNLSRRYVSFRTMCGLALAGILIGLAALCPARADVGVHPILPGGSSLKPEGETPVQMAAEKVVMNVRAATEADNAAVQLNPGAYGLEWTPVWYPAVAEVDASFTMVNPTREPLSMAVWFPLASALESVAWELNPEEIVPRIERFQVEVEGKPVEFNASELPNPKGEDRPPLPWASFPVTFPAGGETHILIRYIVPAQPSLTDASMNLTYIFQTGAGWAGPIGSAELIVHLPYPANEKTIGVLPEGAILEGSQARWRWVDLEPGPEDDFALSLIPPHRWEDLEAARLAVEASPQDAQAWLKLAYTCQGLAIAKGPRLAPGFGPTYQQAGIVFYREAARLLPEDAAPHYGLALLTLISLPRSPSPEQLQPVLDELKIGEALEAKTPASEGYTGSGMVRDALYNLTFNSGTATADAAAGTEQAEASEEARTQTPDQELAPTTAPLHTEAPQIVQAVPPALAPGRQEGALSGEGWLWIAGSAAAIGLGLLAWQAGKKKG